MKCFVLLSFILFLSNFTFNHAQINSIDTMSVGITNSTLIKLPTNCRHDNCDCSTDENCDSKYCDEKGHCARCLGKNEDCTETNDCCHAYYCKKSKGWSGSCTPSMASKKIISSFASFALFSIFVTKFVC